MTNICATLGAEPVPALSEHPAPNNAVGQREGRNGCQPTPSGMSCGPSTANKDPDASQDPIGGIALF